MYPFLFVKLQKVAHQACFQGQLGTIDRSTNGLGRRIREVLPDILAVYPDAKVEQTRHGLLLKPSKPSVPTTMVNGYRLVAPPPLP